MRALEQDPSRDVVSLEVGAPDGAAEILELPAQIAAARVGSEEPQSDRSRLRLKSFAAFALHFASGKVVAAGCAAAAREEASRPDLSHLQTDEVLQQVTPAAIVALLSELSGPHGVCSLHWSDETRTFVIGRSSAKD